MSFVVQYALIAHFFYLKFKEIDLLPLTEYKILLEQAINLGSLHAGGKFEIETKADKDKILQAEIEAHKRFKQALQGK